MVLKNWTKVYLTWINQSKNKVLFFEINGASCLQLFNSFGFNEKFELLSIEKLDQIPSWFRINKPEFDELTSDIYNNQNKDFKITANKKTYDLKTA